MNFSHFFLGMTENQLSICTSFYLFCFHCFGACFVNYVGSGCVFLVELGCFAFKLAGKAVEVLFQVGGFFEQIEQLLGVPRTVDNGFAGVGTSFVKLVVGSFEFRHLCGCNSLVGQIGWCNFLCFFENYGSSFPQIGVRHLCDGGFFEIHLCL